MSLLQYTSGEMFSSTELIRKSKNIFEKLNKNEIEKAVILRDGKPSFMLMDFIKYEKLINDYIKLEERILQLEKEKKSVSQEKKENEAYIENQPKSEDDINTQEYQEALAKIEELELNFDEKEIKKNEENNQQLKDFWE